MKLNKILLTCTTLTVLLSSQSYASEAQQVDAREDVAAASVAEKQVLISRLEESEKRFAQLKRENTQLNFNYTMAQFYISDLHGDIVHRLKMGDVLVLDLIKLVKFLATKPQTAADVAPAEGAQSIGLLKEIELFRNLSVSDINLCLSKGYALYDELPRLEKSFSDLISEETKERTLREHMEERERKNEKVGKQLVAQARAGLI